MFHSANQSQHWITTATVGKGVG